MSSATNDDDDDNSAFAVFNNNNKLIVLVRSFSHPNGILRRSVFCFLPYNILLYCNGMGVLFA